ncbi:MAG: PEP-CTERM sorting domain-containing protein [Terriglobia bacterium]
MKREKSKLAGTIRPLPEDLNKRLTAYALAATAAAGMSLMGAAAPAMANIITDTPTPAFEVAPTPTGFQVFFGGSAGLLGFSDHHAKSGSGSLLAGSVVPLGIPGVMLSAGAGSGGNILKLAAGAPIGLSGNFQRYGLMEGRSSKGALSGSWTGPGAGYMGLAFVNPFTSTGNLYFGWAKISNSVSSQGAIFAKLDEIALDTIPNQTIDAGQTSAAPEPGTLSLLALGALGLLALRKRKYVLSARG